MIEGGADIARLGLELDGREFIATGERSAATLDQLGDRADAATARLREIERAQRDTASSSAAAAQAQQTMAEKVEAARMRFVGIQRVFEEDMAQIRELQVRGFLSPEDAREAGRIAASEYNAGVLSALDEAGPNAMGSGDGVELWTKMAKSLKDVDTQTKATSGGLGRLNQTLTSTLRQVAGLNPVTAQLANTLGGLALSGIVMSGALAGLAALGLAYRKLTQDARESVRANREALDRLQQLREMAALGPLGRTGADVETGQSGLERLQAQREGLRRDLEQAMRQGRDSAVQLLRERIQALDEAYREAAATVQFGEDEIRRISEEAYRDEVSREAQRLASLVSAGEATIQERQRLIALRDSMRFALSESDDPGVRSDALGVIEQANAALGEQATAVDRVVASETERVRVLQEGLDLNVLSGAEMLELLGIARDLRRELERGNHSLEDRIQLTRRVRDLDQQLAESWEARGRLARSGVMVQGLDLELEMVGKITTASTELAQRHIDARNAGKDSAMEFEDAWVAAIQVAGAHMGGFAGQVANVIGAFATGGPWAGGVAAGGVVLDLITNSGESQREREMAQEAERATEALRRLADQLRDISELDRRRADANRELRSALEAALDSLGNFENQIGGLPEFVEALARSGLTAEEAFKRVAEGGMFTASVLENIDDALRNYIDLIIQIEEQRQRDISRMSDELEVRALAAQGFDAEAAARRMELEHAEEMRRARELEDEALIALTESTHEFERQAREAAEAAREAARAFNESQQNLNLDAREADLAGDDMGAAWARAEARRESERRAAEEAFKAGDISEDTFNRWISVIDEEFIRAIQDSEEAIRQQADAAREAAAAAAERTLRMSEDLDVQILIAEGRREEAELLRLDNAFRRDMLDLEDEELRRKRQILYELERENALREEVNEALKDTPDQTNRLFGGQQMTRIMSPFAAVEEFSRVSATDVLRQIEGNTRRTADNIGRLTISATTGSGRTVIIRVEQNPGEDGMAFAQRVANHVRTLDEQFERERMRAERDSGSARIGA